MQMQWGYKVSKCIITESRIFFTGITPITHFRPYEFEQNIFEKLQFEELVFREKLQSSNFIFEHLISSNCIRGICRRRKLKSQKTTRGSKI
jgi:hypothetical protein